MTVPESFIKLCGMKNKTLTTENYLHELLKKKYHTSEVIRSQIARIKDSIREKAGKEPLKPFTVRFKGRVIDCSFEKTLKIISKRLFIKGRMDNLSTHREHGFVEANITATLTEVEALIQYLMKSHLVLHCKKGIVKGASNLLIIDVTERDQLDNFTPDYIHCNYVTSAESYEKYTGRLGEYLVFNGSPLTSDRIGRELRFNKIETKNKVFTTTGLKEIYANLYSIYLILKLDLEQHYLKLRTFYSQEDDLRMVEEKIDELGFFADIFNLIVSDDNPILSNKTLFLDLIKLQHIVENNNWKTLPAYSGYIYSATNKLNNQFKLLEEYNLFLAYAHCVEKFIAKLTKKLFKHKSDFRNEQYNLTANYNELKKLQTISNHPVIQDDYREMLNSFSKLLAYLDFLTVRDGGTDSTDSHQDTISLAGKSSNKVATLVKKCIESIFSVTIEISTKPIFHQDQSLKTEQEKDVQRLILKLNENLEKLSGLKTSGGRNAYLEARRSVPQLTNLSDTLDQLEKLIKSIENKKEMDTHDPFKSIFAEYNKFEILYRDLNNLGILETGEERKMVYGILTDLQKLFFNKPLKENAYTEIINKIRSLEDFISGKNRSILEKENIDISKLNQNPVFRTIIGIKACIQNIIEKESRYQKINTFKNDPEFFSYSARELGNFLVQIEKFHEKVKSVCYYKNMTAFETVEKDFDKLIDELKDIDFLISLHTRSAERRISKEPDIHIDYLKNSQLIRKNLEKAILTIQNQISQMQGFMHAIENYLHQHSFVHSGVATSVLFDQITYLLSNIDVRLLDMTKSMEDMFKESVDTIFHYQVGEAFTEPKKEDIDDLMKEVNKKTIVRKYQNHEKDLSNFIV